MGPSILMASIPYVKVEAFSLHYLQLSILAPSKVRKSHTRDIGNECVVRGFRHLIWDPLLPLRTP
jgi:hypothetical protein